MISYGFVVENIGEFKHFLRTKPNKIIIKNQLTIKIAQNIDEIDDKLLDNISQADAKGDPSARERLEHSLGRIVRGKDKLYIEYDALGEPVTIAVLSYTHNVFCYLDMVETGKKF